jgi:H+/Cl- antiporter ClcA
MYIYIHETNLTSSYLSNAASAGTLGYLGVSRGIVGIPFVNPYQAMYFRYPALLGAAVYGGLFGCLAFFLEGKPI